MADQQCTHLPKRSHNARRTAFIEILIIYGTFIALAIWNWW